MKRQATNYEKIFTKDTSDKGMLSKIHKEFLNSTIRKQTSYLKYRTKDLHRNLSKEGIQEANMHMKRCSISHVTGELQIKTILLHIYFCCLVAQSSPALLRPHEL